MTGICCVGASFQSVFGLRRIYCLQKGGENAIFGLQYCIAALVREHEF